MLQRRRSRKAAWLRHAYFTLSLYHSYPYRLGQRHGLRSPVQTRPAHKIPFTFVSCTGRTADVEWAKEIEEKTMPGARPLEDLLNAAPVLSPMHCEHL